MQNFRPCFWVIYIYILYIITALGNSHPDPGQVIFQSNSTGNSDLNFSKMFKNSDSHSSPISKIPDYGTLEQNNTNCKKSADKTKIENVGKTKAPKTCSHGRLVPPGLGGITKPHTSHHSPHGN